MSALEKNVFSIDLCDTVVMYDPIPGEIANLEHFVSDLTHKKRLVLPKDKSVDPFVYAALISKECSDGKVCIFIPGTMFDAHGTRHGRGGGWFDKFLSAIPCTWIRVGVTTNQNFSNSRLERKLWDEPVDYVLVVSGASLCRVVVCHSGRLCR